MRRLYTTSEIKMLTPIILFILSAITGFILTVSSQSTSPNHVGCTYSFEGLCSTEADKQELAALRQQVRHQDGALQLVEDRIRKQLLNLTKEVMLDSLNHTGILEEQLQTMNTTLYLTKEKLRLVEKHYRNVTTELQQVKENAQQQLEDKQEKLQLVEDRFKNMTTELEQVKENAQQQLEDKQEKLQLVEDRFRNMTTELEQVKENSQQQLEYKQEHLQLVEARFNNVTTELQQVKENAQQQLQTISLTEVECSCHNELAQLKGRFDGLEDKMNSVIKPIKNVALLRPASQSSTATIFNGDADKAVDGNTNAHYSGKSCTHSNGEYNPWWRVDLITSYNIHGVNITNRGDCCGVQLHDLKIEVSDKPATVGQGVLCNTRYGAVPQGATEYVGCKNVIYGRFVTVSIMSQIGTKDYLMLCEVEVIGN